MKHGVAVRTQASIRREMAESEAQDLAAGREFTLDIDVTPSVLISTGIDLESQQSVKVYLYHCRTHG